jgi:hypothetical protein
MTPPRRPEPGLEVLWQRHIPAMGAQGDNDTEDGFVDAVADTFTNAELAFDDLMRNQKDVFADGDFVLTISRRPL